MTIPLRRLGVDDLALLRWAMEPAMHPTAATVAYVVSGYDRTADALRYDLFSCGLEGEHLVESNARAPKWSPTGDRLAYLRRVGDRWQPVWRTLNGGQVQLPSLPGDAVSFDWAPGGEQLLVLTETSEVVDHQLPYRVDSSADWMTTLRRQAWIVRPSSEVKALGPMEGDVSYVRWSPEGSRIAFISDRGVDRDTSLANGLWLLTVGDQRVECLVSPVTPIRALSWSPDGRWIAFLAASRDNSASAISELWVIGVEGGGARRRLGTELDRSLGLPVRGDDERAIGPPALEWTADSSAVLTIYAEGGRSRLASFGLDGGHEDLIAEERCVLEFSSGAAGIAYSWSDPSTPGEVNLWDGGDDRQLTDVGSRLLDQVEVAPTHRVSAIASDGVEVEGWLTLPEQPTNAPLVLQVHGGPHYPVGERFSFDAQRLAGLGLAVLRANPRGSHGYGQAFADGNLGDWGGRDLQDLLELIDEVVRRAGLDRLRVAVIGESYGGFMAAWAVASTDRFAAAVVENGISDFLSSAQGAIGPTFWHSEMGAAPWESPQLYLDRSVVTHIDRVTVPVLVIHCEADTTCPIAHGEAIHSALRQLGREVEFLRVPEEGHFFNVFGALSRRLERTAAIDHFLVHHLHPISNQTEARQEIPS